MANELLTFLSKFDSLTRDEVENLAQLLPVKEAKKDAVLVSKGQICNNCYFVLKGCLRQYVIVDGLEKTTQFYTEEEAAVFLLVTPCKYLPKAIWFE